VASDPLAPFRADPSSSAVLLDVDGVLAPIVARPELSAVPDATLELLARTAVSHARAGADIVAPSDMMDGRVGSIRAELDAEGFAETPIMAYAAKYATALYGPFRDAVDVTIAGGGDRRSYQQDPHNRREALLEIAQDVAEQLITTGSSNGCTSVAPCSATYAVAASRHDSSMPGVSTTSAP